MVHNDSGRLAADRRAETETRGGVMEPLTQDEIRLIECLEPQVAQGPWKHQRIGQCVVTVEECEADCVCIAPSEIHYPCPAEYWEANAQFIVQARHMLPRAIAEIKALRQQLADVTAELEAARAAASAEATFADEMLAERTRLRAELLQQPPTLEWLRETFGEPDEETSTVAVFRQCVFWWYMDHNCTHEYGPELETRAAVLAAVAVTKGANDGN